MRNALVSGLTLAAALIAVGSFCAMAQTMPGAPHAGTARPEYGMSPTSPKTVSPGVVKPAITAPKISQYEARRKILAKGYSHVEGLARVGGQYVGHAVKNGRRQTVRVDANTGQVTVQ